MNTILKELLKVYSKLPVGMLVFKGEKLFFINANLRDTLMLAKMDFKECLGIICGVLQVEASEKKLYGYLRNNDFFSYKNKYVQIASSYVDGYGVFVFTRINQSLIERAQETKTISFAPILAEYIPATNDTQEHNALLKYFDANRRQRVRAYSLYKGVPLIADNVIKQEYQKTLVIEVEAKQMIGAKKGKKWIFKTSSGKPYQGEIALVTSAKKSIFLSNLHSVEEGFHQRETIRYQGEKSLLSVKFSSLDLELPIYDLNESAFRVITKNRVVLEKLRALTNPARSKIKIGEESVKAKSVYFHEVLQGDGEMAVVINFSCAASQSSLLSRWFNETQMGIIKEVKNFTSKL